MSDLKWITGEGWSTFHIQRGEDHPVDAPTSRWTACGRLVRVVLPRLFKDETECGQCLRRVAALGVQEDPED